MPADGERLGFAMSITEDGDAIAVDEPASFVGDGRGRAFEFQRAVHLEREGGERGIDGRGGARAGRVAAASVKKFGGVIAQRHQDPLQRRSHRRRSVARQNERDDAASGRAEANGIEQQVAGGGGRRVVGRWARGDPAGPVGEDSAGRFFAPRQVGGVETDGGGDLEVGGLGRPSGSAGRAERADGGGQESVEEVGCVPRGRGALRELRMKGAQLVGRRRPAMCFERRGHVG